VLYHSRKGGGRSKVSVPSISLLPPSSSLYVSSPSDSSLPLLPFFLSPSSLLLPIPWKYFFYLAHVYLGRGSKCENCNTRFSLKTGGGHVCEKIQGGKSKTSQKLGNSMIPKKFRKIPWQMEGTLPGIKK
jgi:hypothetical protein